MSVDLPPEVIAKKRARRPPARYLLPDRSNSRMKPDEYGTIYASRWSASIKDYVAWYFAYKPVLHSVTWMGVPTRKFVTDLWIYQEILYERRPEIIIELGSLFGGTTLYLAHICELMNFGQVVSIDVSRQVYQVSHPRIIEVNGSTTSPDVLQTVRGLCQDKKVMVIHDGAHGYEQVSKDLENWAPLVSSGQYLIVEDGVVDIFENVPDTIGSTYQSNYPSGGPLKALTEYLQRFPNQFEIDETR